MKNYWKRNFARFFLKALTQSNLSLKALSKKSWSNAIWHRGKTCSLKDCCNVECHKVTNDLIKLMLATFFKIGSNNLRNYWADYAIEKIIFEGSEGFEECKQTWLSQHQQKRFMMKLMCQPSLWNVAQII